MSEQTGFRIIVIDDNPSIHQDFIKILSGTNGSASDTGTALDKINMQLFGKKKEVTMLGKLKIDTASQGSEGVDKIKAAIAEGDPYSLAFVDIRMPPGWDGIETIKHIWEIDKDIQVVICTAYSDYSWEETVEHLGKTDNLLVLKKPFDNVSVRQLACALTTKWQLQQDSRKYTASLRQQVEDRTVRLRESLSIIKATLESSNDGILVLDNQGNVVDYNQRYISMWQIPKKLEDEKKSDPILDYMKKQLKNPHTALSPEYESNSQDGLANISSVEFADGRIYECYSQVQLINGEPVGRVYNFHDVTERAKLEEELQYQATHDALTGLPNRVMLLNRLKESIVNAENNHTIFAVMFLDFDRFKLINDSLSHAVGDELLQAAAKRLQAAIGEKDILARLGGDEFVIVLDGLANTDGLNQKITKIISIFSDPFQTSERSVTVTSSIGISLYPKDGVSVDMLLKNADSAMYSAKENGANNYEYYAPEMNDMNLEKLDQEIELRHALVNGEFFLCYQPQYDMDKNKLVAVEALIRWRHPKKGIVTPMDFIPVAEETGLIIPIGEWALRTACKQNKQWQEQGLLPIRIAVNVSAIQLKQQHFVDLVRSILNETGLQPEYLELELTENVVLSSMEVVKSAAALKNLGVTIAIDDFGTGYSSLGYLRKLPLDRLKIDRSFIQNIKSSDDDEVLVRAIIAVANNLHLEVLAEGVETQIQIDFLKNYKCNEIQGYIYSKPLSAVDLKNFLLEQAKTQGSPFSKMGGG
jgi:diguanylate cyclase (GGDEF)-like protein/PAS domain S-box-containing protein